VAPAPRLQGRWLDDVQVSIQYLAALFALLLLDHYGGAIRDALQSLFVASLL
jgi:hypothetical protein